MNEDIQFLKDLQNELNTQENDGQAGPRFWVIMNYKWEVTAEGHEDRVVLYDCHACETMELDEYVEEIVDGERKKDFEAEDVEELKDIHEWSSSSDVFDWIEEYDDESRYFPIYEQEVSFIAPNTMFLTKEEAKRHLKLNHYHYSSKAHTYAMTAWRAPKVERLINILESFDWDSFNSKGG